MINDMEELLKLPPKELDCEILKSKAMIELQKSFFAVSKYYGDEKLDQYLLEVAMSTLVNLISTRLLLDEKTNESEVFDKIKQNVLAEANLQVMQIKRNGKTKWQQ